MSENTTETIFLRCSSDLKPWAYEVFEDGSNGPTRPYLKGEKGMFPVELAQKLIADEHFIPWDPKLDRNEDN